MSCLLFDKSQFWPAPRINSNVRHNYNSSKKLKCESNTCPTLLILPQLCCKSAQLHISSSDHYHPWLVTTLWYPLTLPEFTRFNKYTHNTYKYIRWGSIYVDQYMLISKIVLKWTIINKPKDKIKSSSKLALFIWFWNFAGKPNWGAKYVLFFGVQESFWLILQKNNTDYWRKNALWLLLARREEKGLSVFRWWGHVYQVQKAPSTAHTEMIFRCASISWFQVVTNSVSQSLIFFQY